MKLNLNFQLKNLDGIEFTDDSGNAAKVFASALSMHTDGPIIKMQDWYLSLWKKESIEIDEADRQLLIAFIETTKLLNQLCKGQIMPVIRNAVEKTDKKK